MLETSSFIFHCKQVFIFLEYIQIPLIPGELETDSNGVLPPVQLDSCCTHVTGYCDTGHCCPKQIQET